MANFESQKRHNPKNGNHLSPADNLYEKFSGQKFPDAILTPPSDQSLTNFLKIYFDFSYYLCLVPFRFQKNNHTLTGGFVGIGNRREVFSVYEWKPQQLVCALMHSLCLLRIITEARWNTPDRQDQYGKNPEQYFLLVLNIFNVFYKGIFTRQVWRHKKRILLVINFAGSESSLPPVCPNFINRAWVVRLILASNMGIALISAIAGKFFLPDGLEGWSPTWWYRRLVAMTRFTFFYGQKMSATQAPELIEIGLGDQVLAGINFVSLMSRYLLGYYTDLYIIAMGFTLWMSTYSFAKSFNHGDSEELETNDGGKWAMNPGVKGPTDPNEWLKIYGRFKALRILSHLINHALGSIVCWFFGNAILAYSINLDAIFVSNDVHKRLSLVFNYLCAFGVLFVSADICKQMESIKLWLSADRNRKQVPGDQLNIILHEMTVKDIGIRGGDIFTVTYPILATFVGTILTYFIICVQQNTPHASY